MGKFNIASLTKEQKKLRLRVLEMSYQRNLSHLGSCLSVIDLMYMIYKTKKKKDIFVLSNGHAGIALYAVLEKFGYIPNKKIYEDLFIHPDRNTKLHIHVSSGSLGQGLPIALGMALADQKKYVYCMISDGESAEGSIWEALRIGQQIKIPNLKIIVNANGWGAYSKISLQQLESRIKGFGWKVIASNGHDIDELEKSLKKLHTSIPTVLFAHTNSEQFPFLKGLDAHYYVMTEKDYQKAQEVLA